MPELLQLIGFVGALGTLLVIQTFALLWAYEVI